MLIIDVQRQQGDFFVKTAIQQSEVGVMALFGASGAGKTSIVNMVAGLSQPDQGHIQVNGTTVFDSEKRINLPPEKRRIGYVFQDGRLFPHLSVRSNLTYGMKLIDSDERLVEFEQVVDLLGIEHLLDRRPAKLSGGEKQRVAIGRALLTSPHLLLMDEPLASLDSARKEEVLPFIQRMCQEFKRPILYVSHSLDEIVKLATHLVLLDAGRVTASGAVDDIMAKIDPNSCLRSLDNQISMKKISAVG
jgi:molybdate transport system ATP-binding protein